MSMSETALATTSNDVSSADAADTDASCLLLESVSEDDLAACTRVFAQLASNKNSLFSPRFRALRVALAPIVEAFEARRFGGLSREGYTNNRVSLTANRTRMAQQRALERNFVDKTALRAARLAKLAELQEGDEATAHRVPDGAAGDGGAGMLKIADLPPHDEDSGALIVTSAAVILPPSLSLLTQLPPPPPLQATFRACYSCKARFQELHHFYGTFCPPCAALNWRKRLQWAPLGGRVALVTGARVKIGFQVAVKLLRAGCSVVATTRFPNDAAARYAALPDASTWAGRLQVRGVDLRDLPALEAFCATLDSSLPRLDIIINNACQTVRRPPAFYAPLIRRELEPVEMLPSNQRAFVEHAHAHQRHGRWAATLVDGARGTARVQIMPPPSEEVVGEDAALVVPVPGSGASAPPLTSAELSQVPVVPGDELITVSEFPAGLVDVNGQQIDLREHNSWTMRMHEVSTPELAEVFCINAMAPFIINARLKSLMLRDRDVPPAVRAAVRARTDRAADAVALAAYLSPSLRAVMLGEAGDVAAAAATSAAGTAGATAAAAASAPPVAAAAAMGKRARVDSGRPPRLSGVSTLLGEVSAPLPASLCRFIINVSAMEGKFARAKTANHPHTNAAKAALNMQTRTSAPDFADDLIFLNSVDTGWINEENPSQRGARTAAAHNFQTPIDEVDAAARILDPIFAPLLEAQADSAGGACRVPFGGFFKDYFLSEW